jgi:response regulator RpfG family c-di-GMP phosphodiesterase
MPLVREENMTTKVPILFIDDEEDILRALKRLLLDEPFEVLTVESDARGLDVLKRLSDIGVSGAVNSTFSK